MDRVEVVTTNQKIALHAKRKELSAALELFNSLYAAESANSHTYASMINAAVQCGDMSVAEDVVKKMIAAGRKLHREVILCTTMMKGYCNEGQLTKAVKLFKEMVERNAADNKPNIRTVNTILRGCLQNGNVAEGEETFNIMQKDLTLAPDVSAWETLIALQCQNLDIDKVLPALGRIKADPMMGSALMRIYLNLARTAALLGESKSCKKFAKSTEEALTSFCTSVEGTAEEDIADILNADKPTNAKKSITGGKRAWKSNSAESTESVDEARNQSLTLYRQHIKLEAEAELELIKQFQAPAAGFEAFDTITSHLCRLLSLPTDSLSEVPQEGSARQEKLAEVVYRSWLDRFGVASWAKRLTKKSVPQLLQLYQQRQAKLEKAPAAEMTASEESNMRVAARLAAMKDRTRRYFDAGGQLSMHQVFTDVLAENVQSGAPLKMEVCSGSGEWACAQAQHDPSSRWMTLEVRQDRVYNTFCRATMLKLPNLSILGGDALQVLPNFFPENVLEQLCVNYPEPPQQRADHDASEAKHLLSEAFFLQAYRILKPNGQLTILTDNQWYGKLVTKILSELALPWKSVQQRVQTKAGKGKKMYFGESASASETNRAAEAATEASEPQSPWVVLLSVGDVTLYQGEPGRAGGHITQASSYFDRLWQRSDQKERYFIVLKKVGDNGSITSKLATLQAQVQAQAQAVSADEKPAKKQKKDKELAEKRVEIPVEGAVKPTIQASSKPATEKPVEKPVQHPVKKPIEENVVQKTQKATEQPIKNPVGEKAAEKLAVKPLENLAMVKKRCRETAAAKDTPEPVATEKSKTPKSGASIAESAIQKLLNTKDSSDMDDASVADIAIKKLLSMRDVFEDEDGDNVESRKKQRRLSRVVKRKPLRQSASL